MENKNQAPIAKKIPYELTTHGHTRIDNYYWLNDRENPEVINYLEAENAYTDAVMADTKALQEALFNEMTGRIKKTDMSVPYKDNGYYYYVRYTEDSEYPVYCRKKHSLDGKEEVILDVNALAKGQDYCHVSGITISPDNKMAAYGVDTRSRRLYTLYFKNLETGETLPNSIENTTGKATWSNDNNTIFYTLKNTETLRHERILKHYLDNPESEEEVYFEKDETFYTGVTKSRSKKYLIIFSESTTSTEFRYLPADQPDDEFRLFQEREPDHEYEISHIGDKFVIRTNKDHATNFKLMETSAENTGKENWKEVVAHRDDVFIESFQVFQNHLVLEERQQGKTLLRIINTANQQDHYMAFDEEAYTVWISINPSIDTDLLRINYTSLTTPVSTYDYHMDTREKTLLKQQEVLGGFNPDHYQSERHYVTARDGARVPISLVYRKGVETDSNNPCLLYGYGSYGHTVDPHFLSMRLSLLDRGFVFAIAHIRGGQMLGRQWYEEGKLLKKKNTFNDFVDCAEYLIENKYTNKELLFAAGGSAGGMLMGAVANMRPYLFKGIIASVPFVDIVTTMLDDSIPLTTSEYDEWGNPDQKEFYDYMLSYSPYDNVEMKDYPAMLVTTGLHDSQVQYWEPAKWVAKLRDMKTDNNMLLLHTNMETGHGGASGRFESLREIALEYAFMLKLLGRVDK